MSRYLRTVRMAALCAVIGLGWIPLHARAQLGSLVVTMTSPASGSTVSGTTTVSANVSIIGLLTVQSVQFQLDGNNLGAADASAPYSISWNTTGAANGSHTLSAVATATLGLQFSSNTITVTVNNGPPPDTTPPAVSITSPANGATVLGTVAVTASASDNVGVVGVQFLRDGVALGAEDTSAPYSVSWNTASVGNGAHSLSAVARDAAGNRTTSGAITVTVNNGPPPDTTPPTVSITSPANGATVQGTLTVTANASDNVGVVGVQFFADGAALGAEDTSAPYSVSVGTSASDNGTHTLTAVARDAAGNRTTSAAITVTVANGPPPDTTPPTVSISSPASGATVLATVTVSASASDNVGVAGVQFLLDGANLGAEDTAAPYSVSWNTTGVANGAHTLSAVARDAAGNRTTSGGITVTVNNGPPPDTTPPSVNITSPANGATVQGTLTVTANASDNVGVVGVQFFADGAPLGAEDLSAPYSVSVGTSAADNGSHTLTAVARDAAGNTKTSAAITVTIANGPPPDTTAPTVSITSPANGATVQGTLTVTANASDNVGVVGVQFFADGAPLGAEDLSAPYSVSVGTSAADNGTHTLTAVARDAAGNTKTSAAVTVTVANATAPAARRFEQTDPSITYTTGWNPDAQGGLSGGTAAVSDAAGAQATFTFTGTSVSWIGGRSNETGIARVFLDGSFVSEIDTYSNTVEVQVPIFTALGLANTTHTLMIEATGQKNAAATLAFIIVDAFDVPATTISRLQDSDPAVTYTGGGWIHGDTSDKWSGGTASASITAGDRATFNFTGTGVRWIGASGPNNGIANVFLDGALAAQVNTLGTSDPAHSQQVQSELFKASGLADGPHSLAIEVTGQKDPAAGAAIINVDAFEVTSSATRREETDPAIAYTAGWQPGNIDHPYSQGTAAVATAAGAQATFTFSGTSVSWIGFRGPQGGMARVLIDGAVAADNLDTFATGEAPQSALFTRSLPSGTHTLTVQALGTKNPASAGTAVVVDAFDVVP